MTRQEWIDHYLQRISDKNFEIYQVRRELEQQNIDEEEIKQIVRAVDTKLQDHILRSATRDDGTGFVRMGAFLMVIGVLLGIAVFIGVINRSNFFLFAYGAFFGGLSVLLIGFFRKKKSAVNHEDRYSDEANKKRVSFRKHQKEQ